MTFNFDREFQSMMQVNDLNTVILLGHLNPDGDAAGSVMGLAHYIKNKLSAVQSAAISGRYVG